METPNSKPQISNKFETPNSNVPNACRTARRLRFRISCFEFVWNLRFRISVPQARHVLSALLVGAFCTPSISIACPFCTALKPTLSQRREESSLVVIAECLEAAPKQATFRLHQVLKLAAPFEKTERLTVPVEVQLKPGSLAILFGARPAGELTWTCQPTNELGLGYFAKAPSLRVASAERLRYFVRYLEHDDPLVAEDAFNEFGYAPYDAVREVAELLPAENLRRWLADPNVRDERKGFYGLALGLAGRLQDGASQAEFLRQQIVAPANDFRAGFDGILAGYLLLTGDEGLELIEKRFLNNSQAKVGDVRHAMAALRFYQEFVHEVPTPRLGRALRQLLTRPEFAAAAIVDLARWQDWESLPAVAALYKPQPETMDAGIRFAIVSYLMLCPNEQAERELKRIERLDPQTVARASKTFSGEGSQ
jgi:hypothetical protein